MRIRACVFVCVCVCVCGWVGVRVGVGKGDITPLRQIPYERKGVRERERGGGGGEGGWGGVAERILYKTVEIL